MVGEGEDSGTGTASASFWPSGSSRLVMEIGVDKTKPAKSEVRIERESVQRMSNGFQGSMAWMKKTVDQKRKSSESESSNSSEALLLVAKKRKSQRALILKCV